MKRNGGPTTRDLATSRLTFTRRPASPPRRPIGIDSNATTTPRHATYWRGLLAPVIPTVTAAGT